VLVAGGYDPSSRGAVASAELYDPASGSWTATASMGGVRTGHTATLLPDGTVLMAGGGSVSADGKVSPLASAELYDPASGSWTAAANMGGRRVGHTATLLPAGSVLVTGGDSSSGDPRDSAELYDPGSGS
jgi:hypothetical protein